MRNSGIRPGGRLRCGHERREFERPLSQGAKPTAQVERGLSDVDVMSRCEDVDLPGGQTRFAKCSTNDAFRAEMRRDFEKLRNGIRPKYLKKRNSAVVC